jgi:hypothetical protein
VTGTNPYAPTQARTLTLRPEAKISRVLVFHFFAFATSFFVAYIATAAMAAIRFGIADSVGRLFSLSNILAIALLIAVVWIPHAILVSAINTVRLANPIVTGSIGALAFVATAGVVELFVQNPYARLSSAFSFPGEIVALPCYALISLAVVFLSCTLVRADPLIHNGG